MQEQFAEACGRLIGGAVRAWARFPLAALSALVVVTAMLAAVETRSNADWVWLRLAVSAGFGVPLGVLLVVAGESRAWSRVVLAGLQAAGFGGLVMHWALLPATSTELPESFWIRTGMVLLALHLAVAVVARHRSHAAFWTFNWSLFKRYWAGVLYAAIFYAGLALALASAVRLFEFTLKPERYAQLWMLVTFGFHPLWLLAGVPAVRTGEQAETEPPRALRFSAGGVLLPLVGVYLAILYPYAVKILATWEWPDGWVAAPVLGLAVIGLLAVLLVQPMAREGLWWAEWFAGRWFGRLLVPMAVLLALAVGVRVGDYGLTESRYAGYVLAGWLAAMGLYFGTGGAARRSLRAMPLSLLIVVVVLAAGPWGLFAVAERAQLGRLDDLLAKHGLMEDGVARLKAQTITGQEFDELRSILDYLHRRHRSAALYARFEPWLEKNAASREQYWGFGLDALGWMQVKASEKDEWRVRRLAFTVAPVRINGFTSAEYVALGREGTEPAGVSGLQLRLSEDLSALEVRAGGEWTPAAGINDALEKQWSEAGQETTPVSIVADVEAAGGESRRLVVLNAVGGNTHNEHRLRIERIDLLVLAP